MIKRTKFITGFLVVVFVAVVYQLHLSKIEYEVDREYLFDFGVWYYTASSKFADGNSLYDYSGMVEAISRDGRKPFFLFEGNPVPGNYLPPYSTLIYWPLTFWDLEFSFHVWMLLNTCLLLATMAMILNLMQRHGQKPNFMLVALLGVFTFSFCTWFSRHQIHGQQNIYVMFLFFSGLYFFIVKRMGWSAAVLIALAVSTKPFMAIGLVPLVLHRQYDLFLKVCLMAALLALISLPVIGWDDYIGYPFALWNSPYIKVNPNLQDSYSLRTEFMKVLLAFDLKMFGGLIAALPIVVFLRGFLSGRDRLFTFETLLRIAQSFLLMGTVMSALWDHHFVLLYPLGLILFCLYTSNLKKWKWHFFVLLGTYGVTQHIPAYAYQSWIYCVGILVFLALTEITIAYLHRSEPGLIRHSLMGDSHFVSKSNKLDPNS